MGGQVVRFKIANIALVIVSGWIIFWWGYYVGFRSANLSELSNVKGDVNYLESVARNQGNETAPRALEVLTQTQHQRAAMLSDASAFSVVDLLLAPVTAPIGVYWLEQVRGGAGDQ